ncbi:MAG: MFS transporter, partial [Pseudomonadales bacterium]|nr:MFS transporter [Pseudomonadales bacterium]
QYFWYLSGITLFVIPTGVQTILFPWLLTVRLHVSADQMGIAQMFIQLPALLLILVGGLMADRRDPRQILMLFHLIAMAPPLLLAGLIFSDNLSYGAMVAYAVATGLIMAFIQPARDSLLNQVAGDQLQKTVTIVMGLNFGAQIFGYLAASQADTIGAVPLLSLQAGMLGCGIFAAWKLQARPAGLTTSSSLSGIAAIKAGLNTVFSHRRMRYTTILVMSMSGFYGGAFAVLNPLVVRDVYGGDSAYMSLSFAAFTLGTILMTALLVASGGIRLHGRALVLSQPSGGLMLVLAANSSQFWIYALCFFCWGMCGAVAMSMSRTIMQESAPPEYRARVMSVFSMANLGGMPLGALLLGYVAALWGPSTGLMVSACGASGIAITLALTTELWEREETAATP